MVRMAYLGHRQPNSPASIPGCGLWLDASDPSTYKIAGGVLVSWTDKSPNQIPITVSQNNIVYKANQVNGQTTFGITSGCSITGSLQQAIGTSDYTLIAVWKGYTTATQAILAVGPTAAAPSTGLGYNGFYNLFEWGQSESDFTAPTNTYVIHIGTRIGGVKTCYINTKAAPTASGTVQNITNPAFCVAAGDNLPVTGELAEVAVIVGTVAPDVRIRLEGYLAQKWGLTSILPTGHPGKMQVLYPSFQVTAAFPLQKTLTQSIAYLPTSFPNCVLWLDAADASSITKTGNTVISWGDKSGAGNTASAVNGPIAAGSSILMNGSSYFTTNIRVPTQSHCLIAVHTPSAGGNQSLFRFQDTNGYISFPYANTRGYITSYGATNAIDYTHSTLTDNSVTTDLNVICANITPNGQQVYLNGASQAYTAVSLTSATSPYLVIGQFTATFMEGYVGTVKELIIYSSALMVPQRQALEAYLLWKWGLEGKLPATHPFSKSNIGTKAIAFSLPKTIKTNYSTPYTPLIYLQALSWSGTGTWYDLSPNGRNATLETGTAQKNAAGNGVVLNGSTSWTFPNVSAGNSWTIGAWYKQTGANVGTAPCLIVQIFTGGNINLCLGTALNNLTFCGAFYTGGWQDGTAITLVTNQWTNIQCTWDGSHLITYINGSSIGSVTLSSTAYDGGNAYRIGRRWDSSGYFEYLTGVVGEIRIYSQPLTAAQVLTEYTSSSANYTY
jgi:Concanavalin A-like lectin/glucanases superfamily